MNDKYGLAFSSNKDCTHTVNLAIDILFRKKAGLDKILPSESDKIPSCSMLHFYTALMFFFSCSKKTISEQIPIYLNRANLNQDILNAREKLYYQAIQSMTNIDFNQSFSYFEQIINQYPQDRIALLMLETLGFLGGMFYKLEPIYNRIDKFLLDDPDYLGMKAFLYCHLNKRQEAQNIILQAFELDNHNAWLEHVYTHTIDETNPQEIKNSISFLEDLSDNWPTSSRFFEGHNWMHLLILYMRQRPKPEFIFEKFEQHIWGQAKPFNFEQNNAFLVLWNAKLNDMIVPNRYWQDLAKYASTYANDYFNPYITITSILAVAKADNNYAQKYVQSYINYLSLVKPEYHKAWKIGLELLQGCIKYINKDYLEAITHIEPVINEMYLIGNSDEQRSIFPAVLDKCRNLVN